MSWAIHSERGVFFVRTRKQKSLTVLAQGSKVLCQSAAALHVLRRVQKLPRIHSGKMWRVVNCILCLIVSSQLSSWCLWATADELDGEVKIEVLYKPELCTPKSKRGDLMNVHYDGFLAKDGSQFYCRLVV